VHLQRARAWNTGVPVHTFEDERKTDRPVRPFPSRDTDAPALLLYTSGSTGSPKAVVHTHRSLLHNTLRHVNAFSITPEDRQSQLYSCGVYGGIRDLLNAVLTGASLHFHPVRDRGIAGLTDFLVRHEITIYCSVVTVFRQWIRELPETPPRLALRWLKLGGEAPGPIDLQHFREKIPRGCRLSLGLGSTETGLACQVDYDASTLPDSVSLGRPAEDIEVDIVDSAGMPMADGEVGEIRIRSRYLSAGYHGQDSNDLHFHTNPMDPNVRIYHTGDLGIRRPDGHFEHRGRADWQVKIRGNRLEPGEIESVLLTHPDILSAAVVTPSNELGENQVVAWLVHTPERRPRTEEVRALIRARLPEFMVPSHIRWIQTMPQTASGKIDRAGLIARGLEPDAPRPRIQPTTETERSMWRIFESVLERPIHSVTDDFFELGGSSLLAVELLSRMHLELGRTLEIEEMLFIPTVERLASLWDDAASEPGIQPRCVRNGQSGPPLFCMPGQGGTVFIYRRLAQLLPRAGPIYAFQLPGLRRNEEPHTSIEALAEYFIRDLRRVQPQGPYSLLGYSLGGTTAFEMARQLSATGETVAFLGLIDTIAPGLRRPRSLRARLGIRRRQLMGWWQQMRSQDGRRRNDLERMTNDGVEGSGRLRNRIARTTAAARRASRAYNGGTYDGPIVLFRASTLRRALAPDRDSSSLGWAEWVEHPIEVHEIEGSHLALFDDDYLPTLANRIHAALERTEDR
jgi:acyl-coenzyme A synthetase/AMP-(fatty) acid ligase/thioesterase domain-containing protein